MPAQHAVKSTAGKGAALLSTLWVPGCRAQGSAGKPRAARATSVDVEANEPEPPPELGRQLRQWPDSRIQRQGECH